MSCEIICIILCCYSANERVYLSPVLLFPGCVCMVASELNNQSHFLFRKGCSCCEGGSSWLVNGKRARVSNTSSVYVLFTCPLCHGKNREKISNIWTFGDSFMHNILCVLASTSGFLPPLPPPLQPPPWKCHHSFVMARRHVHIKRPPGVWTFHTPLLSPAGSSLGRCTTQNEIHIKNSPIQVYTSIRAWVQGARL